MSKKKLHCSQCSTLWSFLYKIEKWQWLRGRTPPAVSSPHAESQFMCIPMRGLQYNTVATAPSSHLTPQYLNHAVQNIKIRRLLYCCQKSPSFPCVQWRAILTSFPALLLKFPLSSMVGMLVGNASLSSIPVPLLISLYSVCTICYAPSPLCACHSQLFMYFILLSSVVKQCYGGREFC